MADGARPDAAVGRRATARRRREVRARAVSVVALCALAFSAPVFARPQTVVPPELGEPYAEAAHARTRLVRLVADLDQLTAEALPDGARAALAASGDEARAALVVVAGRTIPLGLSSAREAERKAHRAAARAVLGEDLAATRALLTALLARPGAQPEANAPEGATPPDAAASPSRVPALPVLRTTGAGVVGALELFDLAPAVAGLLDLAGEPSTVLAARGALHDLHGRWYSGRAAFHALWPRLAGKGADELFLDELAERERTAEARLLALLEADPARHLDAAFAEPSPAFRARVAALVGAAVGAERLSQAEAWARLRTQLVSEVSAQVAESLLAALLELLQGAPAEDPRAAELREALGEVVARGVPALDDLALRALPRLPEPDATTGALSDLRLASGLVARMIDGSRPFDPDLVVQGLTAYAAVARRVVDAGARRAAVGEASDRLRDVVEGRFGASARVRVAAADALASVLSPADVDVLLATVEASTEPSVRYRLLGVLADAAPRVVGARALTRIADALLTAAESNESAVRARAVELLADPRLADAVRAARASLTTFDRRVLELLRGPGAEAERVAVLDVLAGAGSPTLLAELLRADTLRPLATGAPKVLEALVRATRGLAGGDPAATWRAADLLTLELPGAEEAERASRARRVAAALGLVLGLPEPAARALDGARHARVVAWGLELRGPGSDSSEALGALDSASRARLTEVHAAAASAADPDAPEPVVLAALLRVDALTPGAMPAERAEALAAIDRGLLALRARGDERGASRLTIDRARVADAADRRGEAERDFATVLAAGPDLLASRDLRRLAALAREAGRPERAVEALLVLVERAVWRTRPTDVRLADLEALADAGVRVSAGPLQDRVRALFAGVPELPTEGALSEPTSATDGPIWAGLPSAGRAEHERLLTLAARLGAPRVDGG